MSEGAGAKNQTPKIGAGLVAAAAALFGVAIFLSEKAPPNAEPNVLVMALVCGAGLAIGVAAIFGFLALRNGVTGSMRSLSIALCVAPALLGVALAWRVYSEMNRAEAKAATVQSKTAPGATSTKRGPPKRVNLDPKRDAPTPDVTKAPVTRVLFDLDKNAERDAFRKGTWFLAEAGETRLVTAGHLFGPYAGLVGRLKTPLSADERASIKGTATFGGALGRVTNGAAIEVVGKKTLKAGADVASFAFPNASVLFPFSAEQVSAPLTIAAAPSPGGPVWLVVLEGETPVPYKATVASTDGIVAAYFDRAPATFDGLSGAPIVDAKGRVVAVFIGKSNTVDGAVLVGTPLAGALAP